ncbi:hypothetical protein RDWZM_004347 [Blomia tropicalis]|uniref:RING-type E3 ubiquitin transferase n=1 Tax=Blomia tropicalis TaxID=40697 RepID=A0A9Q0MHH0_BLOTA|nr:hypothetical protein RDWZM_004347 [Blomia tropicalis]
MEKIDPSSSSDMRREGPSTSSSNGTTGGGPDSNFDCNICLETAKDAVVSICGHLFCWPCLHQWFETKPMRPTCPVCKNPITREQVIPLYGRGSNKKDPREKKIPPRPQGQRSEPPDFTQTFPNFGFGDGFHMSFGIGAFPFGFFASTFNIGDFRANPAMANGVDLAHDQFISKIFLWMAVIFIIWLLFA